MTSYHSRRAKVLRKALDYVNHDDWGEFEGFMIFGKEAFDIWAGVLEGNSDTDDTPFRDSDSKSTVSRGERAIAKRVSIGMLPDDETVPETLRMIARIRPGMDIEALRKILALNGGHVVTSTRGVQIDEIDAAFANELVDLLDGVVDKVSSYDDMPVRPLNAKVQQYFDQAHRCHLYGLDIACAVLCRAILESALVDKMDPQGKVKAATSDSDSYVSKLIQKAEGQFLDKERAKCAEEVKLAGNKAIHDLPAFRAKYLKRMGAIVDNTRKIVIDLYT